MWNLELISADRRLVAARAAETGISLVGRGPAGCGGQGGEVGRLTAESEAHTGLDGQHQPSSPSSLGKGIFSPRAFVTAWDIHPPSVDLMEMWGSDSRFCGGQEVPPWNEWNRMRG